MNDREQLTKLFATRLVALLMQKGYISRSAATGVKVKELAEKAGCSFEMARRYTNGDALPDAIAIIDIAEWLKVDPGWLLYGTSQDQHSTFDDTFILTKHDLRLLLEQIVPLYFTIRTIQDPKIMQIHEFFCDVISDFARLHAPHEIKLKMLKTSISSAMHFLPSSSQTREVI